LSSRRAALAVGLLSLTWGCAAVPREAVRRPPPREVAAFLLDPSTLAPEADAAEIGRLFRELLAGAPSAELRAALDRRVRAARAGAAAALLRAQIELVAGDVEAARRALAGALGEAGTAAPARLLAARLAELAGESLTAHSHYESLADELPVAAERRDALREKAVEELRARVSRALAERRVAAAAEELARLLELDAGSRATAELQAAVGAARGDARQELEAVRALVATQPASLPLRLRRGELEVEVGDAALGLGLLEELAAAHSGDARVHLALAHAMFSYRLVNSPEEIRRLARSPQLARGDFARLLYWLVPAVRSARPGATLIATDLVDHPAREEIVRVANLGLLRIDEVLHRFEPGRHLTRSEAFRALARLVGERAETTAQTCVYAVRQSWIAETGECLPSAPVSGAEATGWLRQTTGSFAAGGSG